MRSDRLGPIFKLLGVIVGVLAAAALMMFIVLPRVLPLIGVSYRTPFMPTPTPRPIAAPTATPYPVDEYDAAEATTEVVFSDASSYSWFGDPYFYDGVLLLSAGKLVESQAQMLDLYFYYPDTRTAEKLNIPLQNTHFMYARFNESWLVYLDANADGGGSIMVVDRRAQALQPTEIKRIYSGQPEIMLSGDYIAFTDRTGTNMDKLFVVDLNTKESAAVAMFSSSVYGQSKPSLCDDLLCWADSWAGGVSDGEAPRSSINSIRLGSSTINSYDAGTYVHDVRANNTYTAWLTGDHGPDTELYYCKNNGAPQLIASGVVDFGLGSDFVAYCKNETMFAYSFVGQEEFQVSPEHQLTQFLGVSDDKVIWMDVTSRDIGRDIIMFAEIP